MYIELMALCENNEEFYFVDHEYLGSTYRMFTYRLATYSDFKKPSALNCRATMYEITDISNPKLVCRSMQKFFNMHELIPNEPQLDLKNTLPLSIQSKFDGSLISTFINNENGLDFKSKASLHSEHAIHARKLFLTLNDDVQKYVENMTRKNNTVNLEWTSNQNRIVVRYSKDELKILNVIDNLTGDYIAIPEQFNDSKTNFSFNTLDEYHHWIESVISNTDLSIEGYVVEYEKNKFFKLKTKQYVNLHRCKSSISVFRHLLQIILDDNMDDLYMLFDHSPDDLKYLQAIEKVVFYYYNQVSSQIELYYRHNSGLSRKEYAIKAKEKLGSIQFACVMSLYAGKEYDLKGLMIKNGKELFEFHVDRIKKELNYA